MSNNITLTNGIRTNLLALGNTKDNISMVQSHLSTGLSVSNPIDDAFKYFSAKSLNDRATDMGVRKDAIDQAVSTVTVASNALSGLETLTQQMKGIMDSSRSGSATQRGSYETQLKTLSKQMKKLVNDASYNGQNLLNASTAVLDVYFSDKSSSKLSVQGVNFNMSMLFLKASGAIAGISGESGLDLASKLGNFSQALSAYQLSQASVLATYNSHTDTMENALDNTVQKIRAQSAILGNNVAILNVRLDFTKNYINTLSGGAEKLTVADLNAESAKLMSLNTRQQIGTSALSMANQADQGVLQLLR